MGSEGTDIVGRLSPGGAHGGASRLDVRYSVITCHLADPIFRLILFSLGAVAALVSHPLRPLFESYMYTMVNVSLGKGPRLGAIYGTK